MEILVTLECDLIMLRHDGRQKCQQLCTHAQHSLNFYISCGQKCKERELSRSPSHVIRQTQQFPRLTKDQ